MIKLFNQSYLGTIDAMVLWPFILFKHAPKQVSKKLLRHENKHVEQVYRYWIIGFYVLYVYYYLKGRVTGLNHEQAYRANPLEREARRAENVV